MEFLVSSAELLKGVGSVSKAIPTKTSYPILENFLFKLDGNNLEITASDSEFTMRTVMEVENKSDDGSIAVPARQIMDLLREIPDQPISITTLSSDSFRCKWGSGESTLPYFPADDYPEIPSADPNALVVKFSAPDLVEGISNTINATAEDEMRPAMNGIFFDMDLESTTLVASDSHKLLCYTTREPQVSEKSSFILHKKPAAIVKGALDKLDTEVQVVFDPSRIIFTFDQTTIICRTVVGKFPDYRKVIPQNNSNVLKIDRSVMINAIKRIAVCANRASNNVKLEIKPDQLEITAQDLNFSLASYEKLDCEYNGAPLAIGFKAPHLIDVLGSMACSVVEIKFADSRRAALVLPSEEEDQRDKMCGIIMPGLVA